jgi:hypothetical protein
VSSPQMFVKRSTVIVLFCSGAVSDERSGLPFVSRSL